MTREYLGAADFAARAGLATATIRSYMKKGLTPPADVVITTPSGPLRGWLSETIDAWLAARPGQGARTDLRK
jgi:transcriptional regulator, MerR family